MTEDQEMDLARRAKRAHERLHGQSTYIEAHYMTHNQQVRVHDHELGIITMWHTAPNAHRKVTFAKQIGERR